MASTNHACQVPMLDAIPWLSHRRSSRRRQKQNQPQQQQKQNQHQQRRSRDTADDDAAATTATTTTTTPSVDDGRKYDVILVQDGGLEVDGRFLLYCFALDLFHWTSSMTTTSMADTKKATIRLRNVHDSQSSRTTTSTTTTAAAGAAAIDARTVAAAAIRPNQIEQHQQQPPTLMSSSPVVRMYDGQGHVLWIAGGPVSYDMIVRSFAKMGWHGSISMDSNNSSSNSTARWTRLVMTSMTSRAHVITSLSIRCIASEIAGQIHNQQNLGAFASMAQELFADIRREWMTFRSTAATNISSVSNNMMIVMDDVSTLAILMGERPCFALLASLRGMIVNEQQQEPKCDKCERSLSRPPNLRLVIRCSYYDDDNNNNLPGTGPELPVARRQVAWVGQGGVGGGHGEQITSSKAAMHWEHALVEMADHVVDVLPLASGGISKDVHGRITVVSRNDHDFNDCLHDTDDNDDDDDADSDSKNELNRSSLLSCDSIRCTTVHYCITDHTVWAIPIHKRS